MPPETCPNCGADVPRNARACPECGADEATGWSDSASASYLGVPEEHFDYEKFVKDEFSPRRIKPRGVHWLWWLTAFVLLGLFLWFYFRYFA